MGYDIAVREYLKPQPDVLRRCGRERERARCRECWSRAWWSCGTNTGATWAMTLTRTGAACTSGGTTWRERRCAPYARWRFTRWRTGATSRSFRNARRRHLADYICYRHLSSGNLGQAEPARSSIQNSFHPEMSGMRPQGMGSVTRFAQPVRGRRTRGIADECLKICRRANRRIPRGRPESPTRLFRRQWAKPLTAAYAEKGRTNGDFRQRLRRKIHHPHAEGHTSGGGRHEHQHGLRLPCAEHPHGSAGFWRRAYGTSRAFPSLGAQIETLARFYQAIKTGRRGRIRCGGRAARFTPTRWERRAG